MPTELGENLSVVLHKRREDKPQCDIVLVSLTTVITTLLVLPHPVLK